MKNILRKDLYLINTKLQTALASGSKDVYSKGIYLIKARYIE
jgi:hypothetical protein